jgi:iron complex outermembrane receptor protein
VFVRKSQFFALISTAASMSVGLTCAYAQQPREGGSASPDESAAGTNPQEGVAHLQEVVVTSQRKAERLQEVPASVSVIDGAAVTNMNLVSLQELSKSEPAVTISPAGRGDRVSIRGVASGTNASFEQSVPTFVDDVFHGRGRLGGQNLLDVARVEILKGPQTTYFGNNAIGGAISVVTNEANQSRSGLLRALYAAQGEYAFEGMLNLPVSDTLAVRGAVLFGGMDGYINDPTGGDTPNAENSSGRLTAVWKPNDRFDVKLKAEFGDNRQGGAIVTQIGFCPPTPPFVAATGFCTSALAGGDDGQINLDRRTSPGQVMSLESNEFVASANYYTDAGTLTSITAHLHYHYQLDLDADQGPADGLNSSFPEQQDQFSQELRWTSELDGPVQFTIGGYYQESDLDLGNDFVFFFLSPSILSTPRFAPLIPYLPFSQAVSSTQSQKDMSGFASATWDITPKFAMTAAGRWTEVKKDFTQFNVFGTAASAYGDIVPLPASVQALGQTFGTAGNLGRAGTINLSRTDSSFSPAVIAKYKFTPDVNVYASYTEGFKSGGFNGSDSSGDPALLPFDPEEVKAYEAGVKSQFLDHRMLANLSVFHSEYSDLQVTFAQLAGNAIISTIRNAAEAVSKGLEGELRFAATDRLTLGAKFTLLDFKYKSYPNAGVTAQQRLSGQATQDLRGRPRPYAPDTAGTLTVTYVQPLGQMNLTFDAVAYMSSSYYLTDPLDENLKQPGYGTLDLSVSLGHRQSNWDVSLIAKNVTNEDVWVFAQDLTRSAGSYSIMRNRPRNVGIQLEKRW